MALEMQMVFVSRNNLRDIAHLTLNLLKKNAGGLFSAIILDSI